MDIAQQLYLEGPTTISMIEDNLYLGGVAAARNIDLLRAHGITHILTVDIHPLPRNYTDQNHLTTKFVQAIDLPSEDLLSHFDDTDYFIKQGLSRGALLVHCFFGVSRSATVVLAYIMKKYQIPYEKAYKFVQSKRSIIFPNEGFVAQLKLYRKMGYLVNKNSMHLRFHKLKLAADTVRKMRILSKEFYDVIQPDPITLPPTAITKICRCRRCKRALAAESNLMVHQKNHNEVCSKSYFSEPIAWMKVTKSDKGKLHCPKCIGEVGAFNWIVGFLCPCGVQISPAFFLDPTKVEFCNNFNKNGYAY